MSSIIFGDLFNEKFGLCRSSLVSFVICCQFIQIPGRVELKGSETCNILVSYRKEVKVGQL